MFNVAFRSHCLTKGYTLNEHALKPTREDVPAVPQMKTEENIFRFVGIQYVALELRSSATVAIVV